MGCGGVGMVMDMNQIQPQNRCIRLSNLTVSYQRRPAVHHVSGSFADGQATAIVGPNGAGKSTLLKAIMGLQRAEHGQVVLDGLQRADVAYLPQRAEIDLSMPVTVFELVAMGLWQAQGGWRGAFTSLRKRGFERVEAALVQVGLQDYHARPLYALSAGQLQRVLFARLLVQSAQVILLDEPFNAVDARTTQILLDIIAQWRAQGRTLIAVLHDFDQVRAQFPHTLLLAHEVVAWGDTAVVLTDEHLRVANERCQHWYRRTDVCLIDDEHAVITDGVHHG